MDTNDFLARVVAPGNFIATAHKTNSGGMAHTFFERADTARAAAHLENCAASGVDCWYAVASYLLAQPDPSAPGTYQGRRLQANVQSLRTLFWDADIARPGDGKDPSQAYTDLGELLHWVLRFKADTGVPLPNLWVRSGWGAHLYWVLEDALPPDEWVVQAEALKSALAAHNAKGDISICADSARLLRAPGTYNFKVPGSPMPVEVIPRMVSTDCPNAKLIQALSPWAGAVPVKRVRTGSGGTVAGTPPAVASIRPAEADTTTSSAEEAGNGERKYYFSEVATRCEQAKKSWAEHGASDLRDLWYLGWVNLALFMDDGASAIHEIGYAHPDYTPDDTDRHFAKAEGEKFAKGYGPPTCHKINGLRAGVCPDCPYWGRITTPWVLGAPDGDLPKGYRRTSKGIEHAYIKNKGKKTAKWDWELVVGGDVYGPLLDRIGDDRKLTFTYERGGTSSAIAILQSAVPTDAGSAVRFFGARGVSGIFTRNNQLFGQLIVSWIEKLRDLRAERLDPTPPFGWVMGHAGDPVGLSVGGVCYRAGGHTEPAPGGDPNALQYYQPRGTLEGWKKACAFTVANRPDLQILVAAAFASPLVTFTGHNGFLMSAWSRDSAVGKSSALTIGTTVWADPGAMYHLKDTLNSVVYRIGHTRVLPAYWDEIRLERDQEDTFIDTLFMLGQGKEKARLNADSTLKQSGDWQTILVTTGNRPLMDYIIKRNADTNAGAVRLFEFLITHAQLPLSPQAQETIAGAGKHSGQAGRVYAAWLATNWQIARDQVMSVQDKLQQELGGTQPERFFIAGMSCILVGAAIARLLGLADFDVAAMRAYLKDAFLKLRADRVVSLPIGGGVFDIEKLLADFIGDHVGERMVTDIYARAGPGHAPPVVRSMPTKYGGSRLAVHIAYKDKLMRLDKSTWRAWLYKHGFSPSDVTRELESRWKARQTRVLMGWGTHYATGRLDVVELDLTHPDLACYTYGYQDTP